MRDIITVKMGAELFTVSAKETATFFKLTSPKTTVANLRRSKGKCSLIFFSSQNTQHLSFLSPPPPRRFSRCAQALPHQANKKHNHDEIGRIGKTAFVLVKAAGHKHFDAANEGGGEHLNGAWRKKDSNRDAQN